MQVLLRGIVPRKTELDKKELQETLKSQFFGKELCKEFFGSVKKGGIVGTC